MSQVEGLSPVYDALFKNSVSTSWSVLDTNGHSHTPSGVFFIWDNIEQFTIILTDNSDNVYTTSSVSLTVNGYTLFTVPVSLSKQAYQVLVITLNVSVQAQPWEEYENQDILYAMMGYVFPWSMTQGYSIRTVPVIATTTASGTSYSCDSSANGVITTHSASYSYATTVPQSTLKFSVTLSQCQQFIPGNVTLKDSLGNTNNFTTGLAPSGVCGYGDSCPVNIVIYLT